MNRDSFNQKLINVAMTTKSALELGYIFKGFVILVQSSEAFSFTILQQVTSSPV